MVISQSSSKPHRPSGHLPVLPGVLAGGLQGHPGDREGWEGAEAGQGDEDTQGVQAGEAFQRSAEPALHPGPGVQGDQPPDDPHLCLRPHLLQSDILC